MPTWPGLRSAFTPADGKPLWFAIALVEAARRGAKAMLAQPRLGTDPAETLRTKKSDISTVSELCARWEKEAAHIDRRDGRQRKPSAIEAELARMRGHILPLIGQRRLEDLTTSDIERFRDQVTAGRSARTAKTKPRGVCRLTGGRHAAARTVRLLASIFAWGQESGLLTTNPARGGRLEPTRRVQRFLSSDEIAAIGQALNVMEVENVHVNGVRVIRLLMLTGVRKTEIESLCWDDIDFERGFMNLRDTKTGDRHHPLNAPAMAALASVERLQGVPWVVPASRGESLTRRRGAPSRRLASEPASLASACMISGTPSPASRPWRVSAYRLSARCWVTGNRPLRSVMRTSPRKPGVSPRIRLRGRSPAGWAGRKCRETSRQGSKQ